MYCGDLSIGHRGANRRTIQTDLPPKAARYVSMKMTTFKRVVEHRFDAIRAGVLQILVDLSEFSIFSL